MSGLRLAAPLRIVEEAVEQQAEGLEDVRRVLVRELRAAAPTKTGALKGSIVAGRGRVLALFTELHGLVQDARGPHRGWIDRAQRKAARIVDGG